MSVDPSAGPDGRVPRHVWALLVVIVLILGFAVGGTVRAALRPAHPAQAHSSAALSAEPLSTIGSSPVAQLATPSASPSVSANPAAAPAAPAV